MKDSAGCEEKIFEISISTTITWQLYHCHQHHPPRSISVNILLIYGLVFWSARFSYCMYYYGRQYSQRYHWDTQQRSTATDDTLERFIRASVLFILMLSKLNKPFLASEGYIFLFFQMPRLPILRKGLTGVSSVTPHSIDYHPNAGFLLDGSRYVGGYPTRPRRLC